MRKKKLYKVVETLFLFKLKHSLKKNVFKVTEKNCSLTDYRVKTNKIMIIDFLNCRYDMNEKDVR